MCKNKTSIDLHTREQTATITDTKGDIGPFCLPAISSNKTNYCQRLNQGQATAIIHTLHNKVPNEYQISAQVGVTGELYLQYYLLTLL